MYFSEGTRPVSYVTRTFHLLSICVFLWKALELSRMSRGLLYVCIVLYLDLFLGTKERRLRTSRRLALLCDSTSRALKVVTELRKEGTSRDSNRQRPWHCYKVLSRQIWCSRKPSNTIRTVGSLLTASLSVSVKGNGAASVIQWDRTVQWLNWRAWGFGFDAMHMQR